MGRYAWLIMVLLYGVAGSAVEAAAIPAFPGAEGHGAEAIGGRHGAVIEVSNLNDAGPGSFRAAVQARGPRTVVFRVGGTIELKSRVDIGEPFLTIAGQTAPGDGILLKGHAEGGGQMLRIRTHDVIVRHLRIRSGAHGQPGRGQINVMLDPLEASGNRYGDIYNVVLDHLSVSWSLDENIAVFRNVPAQNAEARENFPQIFNVSIQRSNIAEGLYPHSTGLQMGGERVVRDGKSIYNGGFGVRQISVHHNLFANNSHRCPGLGSRDAQVVNNVMYNWSSKCAETHDATSVDWIGNYFKPGPLSNPANLIVHNAFFKGFAQHRFGPPSLYMSGNRNADHPEQQDWDMYVVHYEGGRLPLSWRRKEPLAPPRIPLTVTTAEQAYESVLGDVGANAGINERGEWFARPDAVDRRILDDVRYHRGAGARHDGQATHYSHPDQVGGYPVIAGGEPYTDTDHDGMADTWERLHGLDEQAATDGAQDLDEDGYTNLEEFLNGANPP